MKYQCLNHCVFMFYKKCSAQKRALTEFLEKVPYIQKASMYLVSGLIYVSYSACNIVRLTAKKPSPFVD